MVKHNYKSILFATALALAALFVSQALWIRNASRQEMRQQDISFQTCFNQSITTLVNRYMQRDVENRGYNIEPIKDENVITPQQKEKAIDAGNTTDETNVPLLIENALVVLSIDNHHFRLTDLDSLIRASLNDDESILSSNLILQDIRNDSLLEAARNSSVSNNKSFFAKTYTAERKIETPAKSYLIKAEYEIKQPGYLQRLGTMTIISVVASAIIISVLFYLIHVFRNQHKEITNMKHSFHGAIHDLKSPLAFTFFSLSTLEEDETNPRKKAALSAASDRVSYLTDKIMRLLQSGRNMEKMEEKDKEEVFLYDVLTLIETEIRTMFPTKDIRFENRVEADLSVRASPDLMEAALRILIENAVKYNNDKPIIEISTTREADTVKIAISDNGLGIKGKEQKHIFKPYYTSDQKHGTGIGLNYAQRIIKAHNGSISVQSAHGKGSTFTITIPVL